MKYKKYQISSHTEETCYELGFKCPEHPNGDHVVINKLKKGVSTPSQSAKFLWLNYLEKKSTMFCLEEEREIVFATFSQQSLLWFTEVG